MTTVLQQPFLCPCSLCLSRLTESVAGRTRIEGGQPGSVRLVIPGSLMRPVCVRRNEVCGAESIRCLSIPAPEASFRPRGSTWNWASTIARRNRLASARPSTPNRGRFRAATYRAPSGNCGRQIRISRQFMGHELPVRDRAVRAEVGLGPRGDELSYFADLLELASYRVRRRGRGARSDRACHP